MHTRDFAAFNRHSLFFSPKNAATVEIEELLYLFSISQESFITTAARASALTEAPGLAHLLSHCELLSSLIYVICTVLYIFKIIAVGRYYNYNFYFKTIRGRYQILS